MVAAIPDVLCELCNGEGYGAFSAPFGEEFYADILPSGHFPDGLFSLVFLARTEQAFPNQSMPLPHLAMTLCLLLGRLSSFAFLPAVLFSSQPLLAPGGGVILLEL